MSEFKRALGCSDECQFRRMSKRVREADRLLRLAAIELVHEGLGVDGIDEWLGVPKGFVYAGDYVDWLEGRRT